MSPDRSYEREAIEGLRAHLHSAGHDAKITGWPEEESRNALTVDAELLIDGTAWALEHARVTPHSALPAARQHCCKKLCCKLQPLAEKAGVTLMLSLYPPFGKALANDYYEQVKTLAEEALGEAPHEARDGQTFVSAEPGDPGVLISFWSTDDDPLVRNQVSQVLVPLLDKKLATPGKRLLRAKECGIPTMLLLDQQPDPAAEQDSMWLPLPETIGLVLADWCAAHPGRVDAAWLRSEGGTFHMLPVNAHRE